MSARLGFVGLGVMGLPMARHLSRTGHSITVWNRTAAKAEPLVTENLKIAETLSELAKESEIIFLCVTRTEDVQAVLDELTQSAKEGTLFVDHSTISPTATQEIAKDLTAKGFRFIDAPITGGSVGAQKGQLTIFLGGAEADVAEVMPYLQAYAKRAERVGENGAGQMAKMANQIAVGGALLAMCESLSFAQKAGLDIAQIRELVGGGAGGSWAFENYGKMVLAQDWTPGFSISNQRKDFAYCAAAADQLDAAIPGTQLVDSLLKHLQDEGNGEQTTAALFTQLMRMGFTS